jgi:serine/threonine protein kinase
MTPEQWQRVEEVLQAALDRSPVERASFLEDVCGDDEKLKDETRSLLTAYDAAEDFIEQPAMALDARVLIGVDDENSGRELGPYKIVERLGAGGMGEVYLAQDARLNRMVALKILPAYFASDDDRLRRFQSEARAASALNHPNILTIYEVGESPDFRFIATEFIEGQTIRELIAKGNLSVAEILEVAAQVAFALSAAHAAGIVHRDIKPENIMRRHDGLVKILDFGIAKLTEQPGEDQVSRSSSMSGLTEAGVVMGTVDYMSPEQARAFVVDERTDVWSLGVVLYEMLSGSKPFAGPTRIDTMVAILEREPRTLSEVSVRPSEQLDVLQSIVDKALRKDRNERYQTAAEMLADIQAAATEGPRGASSADSSTRLTTRETSANLEGKLRSRPMLVVAALLLVLMVAVFVYRRWATQLVASGANKPDVVTEISDKPYSAMTEAEQLAFVDLQANRISTMMGDRPVKLNDEALRSIKSYVDWYVSLNDAGKPGVNSLSDMFARAKPYVPLISRTFASKKVPVIIGIYLPMIESAYRNCYENSIGAKGLYQFMPQTAKRYGVASEEMCDETKMTPAAAQYIADHMADLGDDAESMTLVLLSYNTGAEWVRASLRELRETEHYERNFWTLLANRDKLRTFQQESAGYVPRFFAAAIIGENPKAFGLAMQPLSQQ